MLPKWCLIWQLWQRVVGWFKGNCNECAKQLYFRCVYAVPFYVPGGALEVAYKSGCILWMLMSKSELRQILGRVEEIEKLSASAGSQLRPAVVMQQRLSSSDLSTNWQQAYAWLKAEANRAGWTVGSVYEDISSRRIKGRIFFILEMTEDTSARIRRGDGVSFEIAEGEAELPVIHLQKQNWEGRFLVYHEYNFHSEAVYPLLGLLNASSLDAARNSCFKDEYDERDRRRILVPFSWWGVLLRRELDNYEQNDARAVEIRRILRGWQI